jgi:hypothetical protein
VPKLGGAALDPTDTTSVASIDLAVLAPLAQVEPQHDTPPRLTPPPPPEADPSPVSDAMVVFELDHML